MVSGAVASEPLVWVSQNSIAIYRLHALTAVSRPTRPSILCVTLKWVSAFRLNGDGDWWGVDDSSVEVDSQPMSVGLVWKSAAAFYSHQMNKINSHNVFVTVPLASCLIYARALLEYVIIITGMWLRTGCQRNVYWLTTNHLSGRGLCSQSRSCHLRQGCVPERAVH